MSKYVSHINLEPNEDMFVLEDLENAEIFTCKFYNEEKDEFIGSSVMGMYKLNDHFDRSIIPEKEETKEEKKLINSKRTLIEKLRSEPEKLKFKTIRNTSKPDYEGMIREVGHAQSNAFTLKTEIDGKIKESWIHFDKSIKVNKGKLSMYLIMKGYHDNKEKYDAVIEELTSREIDYFVENDDDAYYIHYEGMIYEIIEED